MAYKIRNTGHHGIILWMETPCGIKQPLIRWKNLDELKVFGDGLLDYYRQNQIINTYACQDGTDDLSAIAEKIFNQAFADDGDQLENGS